MFNVRDSPPELLLVWTTGLLSETQVPNTMTNTKKFIRHIFIFIVESPIQLCPILWLLINIRPIPGSASSKETPFINT